MWFAIQIIDIGDGNSRPVGAVRLDPIADTFQCQPKHVETNAQIAN